MPTQGRAGQFLRLLIVPLVLAGGLTGLVPAASAAPCQNWTGVLPPSPGSTGNVLDGVALVSACDAWAVGFGSGGGSNQTLIEHWDGAAWTVIPAPSPGTAFSTLTSVRAVSATDAWAVGSFSNGTGNQTLILHWNGTNWQQVTSPSPGNSFNELNGVRVVSANDAWAVGVYADGGTSRKTLILHWNGATWTQVASPDPGGSGNDNYLFAVAATSHSDAWAVGEIVTSTGIQTLALHWNGTRWAQVVSPSPGTASELFAVGVTSASNAWAVGEATTGTTEQTLALHWDGRTWARVASPNPGGQAHDNTLDAVAVIFIASVWAVGIYETGTGQSNIVLHWNGRTWAHVNSPNPGTENGLF